MRQNAMVHLVLTVTAMSVSLSVCTYFNSLLYFAGSLQFAAGRGGQSKGGVHKHSFINRTRATITRS